MADSVRQRGIDRAMGEAMYQIAMGKSEEERQAQRDELPFQSIMDNVKQRSDEISKISKDEQAILSELCSFFDTDRDKKKEDKIKEVFRARAIIEELQMNVNFPALAYGETFLAASVLHSLEMMQMLIEKGADVNMENEMMCECAIDILLEIEEGRGLSDEEGEMKKLLLEKGAKTAEERLMNIAESARKKRMGGDSSSSDDDDESESD